MKSRKGRNEEIKKKRRVVKCSECQKHSYKAHKIKKIQLAETPSAWIAEERKMQFRKAARALSLVQREQADIAIPHWRCRISMDQ